MPDLHTRLKNTRRSRGLSQHQLAAMCGVSQPTVAHWERGGHIPRQKALKVLAECLDVDIAWLMSGQDFADTHPAHRHVSLPIQHIPVYEWCKTQHDLRGAHPIRYISLSVDETEVFAMLPPKGTEWSSSETLIFGQSKSKNNDGTHLCAIDEKLSLSKNDGDRENSIGRLIYSVKTY